MQVFFIGTGRLAINLATAFRRSGVEICGCYSRNKEHGERFSKRFQIPYFPELNSIPPDCNVYLLAVSDKAITEVARQMNVNGIVAHCSGMLPVQAIEGKLNKGVFWPLQTLSMDHLVEMEDVPVCVEAELPKNCSVLKQLADTITRQALEVTLEERRRLHLAAVLVNNFTNHLFHLASLFLEKNGDTFEHLKPIILETARKVQTLEPGAAQTGPAVRHDKDTIERHRSLLESDPQLLHVYDVMTQSISDASNP